MHLQPAVHTSPSQGSSSTNFISFRQIVVQIYEGKKLLWHLTLQMQQQQRAARHEFYSCVWGTYAGVPLQRQCSPQWWSAPVWQSSIPVIVAARVAEVPTGSWKVGGEGGGSEESVEGGSWPAS
jgi:hypothetical protein